MTTSDDFKAGISYYGNRIPEHFTQRDLPDIVAHGCTYIVHTFSENDLQYYKASLQEMILETHKAGLEVYLDPWGVGGVFGGEEYSNYLLQNTETWQMRPDGSAAPMACLNAPEFREFIYSWIDAASELNADVIFWDEPHLYIGTGSETKTDDWTCCCTICRKLFGDKYNIQMPSELTGQVHEFREDTIVRFLSDMCSYAKTKGLRNAICLAPFDDEWHGIAHWDKVACIANLDILGVTPFWQFYHENQVPFFERFVDKVITLSQTYGLEAQVWLQAFLVPANSEDELVVAADLAATKGVHNLAAWGFKGASYVSVLRSEKPESVWTLIGEIFRRFTRAR